MNTRHRHNMRTLLQPVTKGLLSLLLLAGSTAYSQSFTFAGWSAEEEASRPVIFEMLESFNQANPGTQATWLGWPWSQVQQSLVLRYRSGEATELSQLQERWLPTFATLDALVDLGEVFGQDYLESQIDPGLLRLGNIGGKQLGIPWTAASIGMVANTRVLSDAGVSELPTTVDEFVESLRAIKAHNPDSVPYALMTKNNLSMSPDFQIWLWTFGGQVFDEDGNVLVDSPEGLAALTFMVDLLNEGLAARDIDRPDARRLFAQHQTGFYFDAPLARGFARTNSGDGDAFDRHVAALPTPVLEEGNPPRSVAWGHLLVMFKHARQEQPTVDSGPARLLAHLAFNDEPQLAYFDAVGLFPVSRSALAAPAISSDDYVSVWSQAATTALRDEPSLWPNSAELTNVIGEEVQSALLGQKTPERAITDMAARLESLMQEVR